MRNRNFLVRKPLANRTSSLKLHYPSLRVGFVYSENALYFMGYERRLILHCLKKNHLEFTKIKGLEVEDIDDEIIEKRRELDEQFKNGN